MVRLTKLHGNESIPCSRCDHPAAVLLFNGSKVASASQLIFLCREDLRVFLRKHPLVKESLIADFGATAAELALD